MGALRDYGYLRSSRYSTGDIITNLRHLEEGDVFKILSEFKILNKTPYDITLMSITSGTKETHSLDRDLSSSRWTYLRREYD